jgi:transcriptional regulator with XRE-family HTH domain
MPNERLRDTILRKGLTPAAVAERLGVDPKTVERWITQDRTPYPKHRHAIAAIVGEGESYLWPNALSTERGLAVAQSELVTIYPRRGAVPPDLWRRLLNQATKQIGILAYGALFLHEFMPDFTKTLIAKSDAGARVEVLLGDPASEHVAQRGRDEGVGPDMMPAKIRNTLAFYEPMRGMYATVMFHDTVLYNSIYRFDDEMLVNTHLFGHPAVHAPVMHLRRLAGGDLFDTYAASYERVRARAHEVWPE